MPNFAMGPSAETVELRERTSTCSSMIDHPGMVEEDSERWATRDGSTCLLIRALVSQFPYLEFPERGEPSLGGHPEGVTVTLKWGRTV